jgi:hypothetical protein
VVLSIGAVRRPALHFLACIGFQQQSARTEFLTTQASYNKAITHQRSGQRRRMFIGWQGIALQVAIKYRNIYK